MYKMSGRNPHMYCSGRIHRRKLMGCGMGSVLLNVGGAGGGSAYPSVADYTEITGRQVKGGDLGNKLDKLMVKPISKKPHNIKFDI
jgi:hypothetical protein